MNDHLLARSYEDDPVDKQLGKVSLISQSEMPTTASIPRMGPTGNYLPPSPLQNSEDFEETSEHSSCPDTLKVAIPDTPIVALRSPCNLRELIMRAKLKMMNTHTQTGNSPCNSTHCKTCHMTMREGSFMSRSTGTTQGFVDCARM